jgi:hypothetical protein
MALLKEGQKPGQTKLTDLLRGARRQDVEGFYRLFSSIETIIMLFVLGCVLLGN